MNLFGDLSSYNRFSAFGVHFLLSLIILFVLLGLMYCFWFPGETFIYDGGLQGLKILVPVDLVLGPALTLIIFTPKKKGLKFDLVVIATIQIAALSWGVSRIVEVRSHYHVYYEGEFYSVNKEMMMGQQIHVAGLKPEEVKLPLQAWYEPAKLVTLTPVASEDEQTARLQAIQIGQYFGTGPVYDHTLYTALDTTLDSEQRYRGIFRYYTTTVSYDPDSQTLINIELGSEKSFKELLLGQ